MPEESSKAGRDRYTMSISLSGLSASCRGIKFIHWVFENTHPHNIHQIAHGSIFLNMAKKDAQIYMTAVHSKQSADAFIHG